MARDRQRAKRRKARAAGGTPGGSSRPAVPDPLKHSSASVDEALLAETGLPAPPVGGGLEGAEDYRTPDAVEGDFDPKDVPEDVRAELRAAQQEDAQKKASLPRRTILFLGHVIDELRRVQWPNRRQTMQGTAVTLGFVVIAGAFLGVVDELIKPLIKWIL